MATRMPAAFAATMDDAMSPGSIPAGVMIAFGFFEMASASLFCKSAMLPLYARPDAFHPAVAAAASTAFCTSTSDGELVLYIRMIVPPVFGALDSGLSSGGRLVGGSE